MKCRNCDKKLPNEGEFCPSCGNKIERVEKKEMIEGKEAAGEEIDKIGITKEGVPQDMATKEEVLEKEWAQEIEKEAEKEDMEGQKEEGGGFIIDLLNNKTFLFLSSLAILVIVLLFIFSPNKLDPKDIDIEFNLVPGPYERMIGFIIYYDQPVSDVDGLEEVIELFRKEKIPLTIFFTPAFTANRTAEEIFNMGDVVEFRIEEIDFEGAEIGTSSFVATNLAEMQYSQQELLVRKSKNAFKEKGIRVKGFYPAGGYANFDTLLVLENAGFDYMTSGFGERPEHPDSPLGIKMNILMMPIYRGDDWQNQTGVFLVQLNPEGFLGDAGDAEMFFDSVKDDKTLILNISEVDRRIREKEGISARLLTDLKRKVTEISMNDLSNNTRLDIDTELDINSVYSGNETINYFNKTDGYYIYLNETDEAINIYWKS